MLKWTPHVNCDNVGGYDYHNHDDLMIGLVTWNVHVVPRLPAHQSPCRIHVSWLRVFARHVGPGTDSGTARLSVASFLTDYPCF